MRVQGADDKEGGLHSGLMEDVRGPALKSIQTT